MLAVQRETGGLVDLACRRQAVIGPQGDVGVPDLAGEAQALGDELCPDTEAARPWLDYQQAEPGRGLAVGHAEDRAGRDPVHRGDPAGGAVRVRVAELRVLGDDARA